jgi:hypothetical protein
MTPERAAAAMLACEVDLLAGAPLTQSVIDLLAPFMKEPFEDRKELARARVSFRKALRAAYARVPQTELGPD